MVTADSPRGLPKAVKKIFQRKIFDCGGTNHNRGYGGISPHHHMISYFSQSSISLRVSSPAPMLSPELFFIFLTTNFW